MPLARENDRSQAMILPIPGCDGAMTSNDACRIHLEVSARETHVRADVQVPPGASVSVELARVVICLEVEAILSPTGG